MLRGCIVFWLALGLWTQALGRDVEGTVALAQRPTEPGRLVVWWTAPAPAGGSGWDRFLRLIPRFQVLAVGTDLGGRTYRFTLTGLPAGPATAHAVYDTAGQFWSAVLGGGGALRGAAPVPGAAAPLHIPLTAPTQRPPRPEYCTGPRFRLLHVDAPFVAGAVGNAIRRRLCVYLPPGYAAAPKRRYPVVYLLPGLASTDRARLDGDVRDAADAIEAQAILVAIDTSTVTGSAYFTRSPASGDWLRFVEAAVARIDRDFRTTPDAARRALVGQSTGGFNAVSLALRRPDLFTAVGASAPDGLDLEGWLTETRKDGRYLRPRWLTWMRLEAALAQPDGRQQGQFVSYAADWSGRWPLAWPADLKTGRIRPAIWAQWRAQSPLVLLDDPARLAAARARLAGRIFLAVARGDEFDLYRPTAAFSERLTALGVAHRLAVSDGGHGEGEDARLRAALVFVLDVMGR